MYFCVLLLLIKIKVVLFRVNENLYQFNKFITLRLNNLYTINKKCIFNKFVVHVAWLNEMLFTISQIYYIYSYNYIIYL